MLGSIRPRMLPLQKCRPGAVPLRTPRYATEVYTCMPIRTQTKIWKTRKNTGAQEVESQRDQKSRIFTGSSRI